MPTIEDLIIQEVKRHPSIYSPRFDKNVDNKKYFAAIAQKIDNKRINGTFDMDFSSFIFNN